MKGRTMISARGVARVAAVATAGVWVIVFGLAVSAPAQGATLLGQYSAHYTYSGWSGYNPCYVMDVLIENDTYWSYVSHDFTADGTQTFNISSLAQSLTNGVDNGYRIAISLAGWGPEEGPLFTESEVFGTHPDFAGCQVDYVALTVQNLTFVNTWGDVPDHQPWPYYILDGSSADITWGVYGTPEPATLSLLALGGAALVAQRKRRK